MDWVVDKVVGSSVEFFWHSNYLRMPANALLHFARKHCNEEKRFAVVKFGLIPRKPLVIICDIDLARLILAKDRDYWKGHSYSIIQGVTPNFLPALNSSASGAAIQRKECIRLLSNKCRWEAVKDLVEKYALNFVSELHQHRLQKLNFDCHCGFREFTLNVMLDLVFGGDEYTCKKQKKFVDSLRFVMKEWQLRIAEISPVQHVLRIRQLNRARDFIYNFISSKLSSAVEEMGSIVSDLFQNSELQHADKVDVIFTLLTMGHENVASCLTSCVCFLKKYPSVLLKLKTSQDNQCIRNFIHETLRVCPPIPIMSRKCLNQDQLNELLGAGLNHDCELVISPYVIHRLQDDEFCEELNVSKPSIAFGVGPRACFGQQMANYETEFMLRLLIELDITIISDLNFEKDMIMDVSLMPCSGLYIM